MSYLTICFGWFFIQVSVISLKKTNGSRMLAGIAVVLLMAVTSFPQAVRSPGWAYRYTSALSCKHLPPLVQICSISSWSHWSRGSRSPGCCWERAAQTLSGKLSSGMMSASSAGPYSPCRAIAGLYGGLGRAEVEKLLPSLAAQLLKAAWNTEQGSPGSRDEGNPVPPSLFGGRRALTQCIQPNSWSMCRAPTPGSHLDCSLWFYISLEIYGLSTFNLWHCNPRSSNWLKYNSAKLQAGILVRLESRATMQNYILRATLESCAEVLWVVLFLNFFTLQDYPFFSPSM